MIFRYSKNKNLLVKKRKDKKKVRYQEMKSGEFIPKTKKMKKQAIQ
jgi:hypothetical protein